MRVCPFPGLVPYEEGDADRFFGRETETRVVTDNLRASPLTILYGASGAGKSSLLRAGVYHTLKSEARAEFARAGLVDYVVVVHHTWRNPPAEAIAAAVRREAAELRG